ncbi:hypothetical protein K0B96_06555 [Horticoccus luteus]|uniref:Uncharacterized protein n=1 Tax=Horticoccus luteus TaxID=2862869 RepID=A0A8F9TY47_9BACT|nr:hypothetical protein [Horticoccus luteus]QYM80270.1 hypothetical protein K0B96_06555 [Horticoccus luteus]
MSNVSKRLIYQRTDWQIPSTDRLQQLFQRALTQRAGDARAQPISEDASATAGTWRKITYASDRNGCAFGKLVQFTHGLRQETVRVRQDGAEPPEGSVAAPAGEEFSGGALYFCFDGDHVVVAQSQSLRISQLEEYLNWLLREQLPAGNFVTLLSLPPAAGRRILERTPPTSVMFSRPVELPSNDQTGAAQFNRDAKIDALQTFLGVDDLRTMMPHDVAAGGRVQTSIRLWWTKKTGGVRPDEFLQGLGRVGLRMLDEDPSVDIAVDVGATTLTRRQLSMAESCSIALVEGRVPPETVWDRMLRFLARLRERGEILD